METKAGATAPITIKEPESSAQHDSSQPAILLFGDSQLEGLRTPVEEYCVAQGYNLRASILWYGSTTQQWAESDTLTHFLDRYRPDFVLISLGLNELFLPRSERRVANVRKILAILDQRQIRHFWIGPAAWRPDRGIVKMLEEINGPAFYPSQNLVLARATDGCHPTRRAARAWFDSVATHLPRLLPEGEKPKSPGVVGHRIILQQVTR